MEGRRLKLQVESGKMSRGTTAVAVFSQKTANRRFTWDCLCVIMYSVLSLTRVLFESPHFSEQMLWWARMCSQNRRPVFLHWDMTSSGKVSVGVHSVTAQWCLNGVFTRCNFLYLSYRAAPMDVYDPTWLSNYSDGGHFNREFGCCTCLTEKWDERAA